MKLNLGCGRDIREGWVNVDMAALPGVDVIMDLDMPDSREHWEENSVDEMLLSHTIEHLNFPLQLMEDLWHVATPHCPIQIRCPHGASDDADEDPTHVRRMFPGSFGYFGQPYYWRAQYNTTDERDVFGRRVHPSPLCPWHVQDPLSADEGPRLDGTDQAPSAQRSGPVLEGRLHPRHRSEGPTTEADDRRAPVGYGADAGSAAAPLGERAPQERGRDGQLLAELGALVQTAARRSESRGLAELGRLLLPGGVASAPELGEDGCVCTRADYGYRGDWQTDEIILVMDPALIKQAASDKGLTEMVNSRRNTVAEMIVYMHAVKPAREPKKELQVAPRLSAEAIR